MAQEREAIDVGHEMAVALLAWRPTMHAEDVTAAIMHALERYSTQIEGSGEVGLASCFYALERAMEERRRSI